MFTKQKNPVAIYHLSKGFTLIELILSITIIVILSSVMIQIVRLSDTQKILNLGADQVESALRMAQSYALSIPVGKDSSGVDTNKICGFGVSVSDNSTYIVFYRSYVNSPDECANANNRTKETFKLPQVITFNPTNATIFFNSPYGDTTGGSITINKSGSGSKTISVNSFGSISK